MNNQLIQQAARNISTETEQPINKTDHVVGLVNRLFAELIKTKLAAKHNIPNDEDLSIQKAIYVRTFMENNVNTSAQLSLGMKRARADANPFFPVAGQFVAWCKPTHTDVGMVDPHTAWMECCNNSHRKTAHKWSHHGVHEAGSRTGWFAIRQGEVKERVFTNHYYAVVAEVFAGAVFELPAMSSSMIEQHRNGKAAKTQRCVAARNAAIAALKGGL